MPKTGKRSNNRGRGLRNASKATRQRVARAGAEARWGISDNGMESESFFSQITGGGNRRSKKSR